MKKLLTLIFLFLIGYAGFSQAPTSVYWLKSRVNGSVPVPVSGWGSIYYDYVTDKWKFCNGTNCYDIPTSSSGGTVTTRNNLPPVTHTSSFTLSPADTSKMHILSGGSGAIVVTMGTFSGLSGKGLQFAFRRDRTDTVYFATGSETIIQSPGATLGVSDSTFAYLYYNGTTDKFYLANGGGGGGGSGGGGSGTVETVVAGNLIDVNSTDAANPIVSVETGDKGDITLGSNTLTIDNNAVTFAKMQAIGTNTLLGASGGTAVEQISVSSPLTLISDALGIQQATSLQSGSLSSTDWSTFNGKQNAITFGTGVLTALGVNIGSAGAPVLFNGAGGAPTSLTIPSSATATTQSAGTNNTTVSTTAYADAKVAEAITNGVTGIAPSEDQVFDALALKQGLDGTLTNLAALASLGTADQLIKTNSAATAFEYVNTSTGAAVTVTDGAYIDLGLTGSSTTGAVNAFGITAEITGQIPVDHGGTGFDNTTQTYTPTLTNTANLSASTASVCLYYRIGNMVTVSGRVTIDPTTTATLTTLGISLPVASALTSAIQAGGTASAVAVADASAGIFSDATNDRATLQYVCTDVTNHDMYFTFTYQVL